MYEVDCPRCFLAFPVGAQDRDAACPHCGLAVRLEEDPERAAGAATAASSPLMEFERVEPESPLVHSPCPACSGPLLLAPEDEAGLCPHCDARLAFADGAASLLAASLPAAAPTRGAKRPYAPLVVCRPVAPHGGEGSAQSPGGAARSAANQRGKRGPGDDVPGGRATEDADQPRRARGRDAHAGSSATWSCFVPAVAAATAAVAAAPRIASTCAVDDGAPRGMALEFSLPAQTLPPLWQGAASTRAYGGSPPHAVLSDAAADIVPFMALGDDEAEFDLDMGAAEESAPPPPRRQAEKQHAVEDSPDETDIKRTPREPKRKPALEVERKVDPDMPQGIPAVRFGRKIKDPELAIVEDCPQCSHPFHVHPRDREAQCPHCMVYVAFDVDPPPEDAAEEDPKTLRRRAKEDQKLAKREESGRRKREKEKEKQKASPRAQPEGEAEREREEKKPRRVVAGVRRPRGGEAQGEGVTRPRHTGEVIAVEETLRATPAAIPVAAEPELPAAPEQGDAEEWEDALDLDVAIEPEKEPEPVPVPEPVPEAEPEAKPQAEPGEPRPSETSRGEQAKPQAEPGEPRPSETSRGEQAKPQAEPGEPRPSETSRGEQAEPGAEPPAEPVLAQPVDDAAELEALPAFEVMGDPPEDENKRGLLGRFSRRRRE